MLKWYQIRCLEECFHFFSKKKKTIQKSEKTRRNDYIKLIAMSFLRAFRFRLVSFISHAQIDERYLESAFDFLKFIIHFRHTSFGTSIRRTNHFVRETQIDQQ